MTYLEPDIIVSKNAKSFVVEIPGYARNGDKVYIIVAHKDDEFPGDIPTGWTMVGHTNSLIRRGLTIFSKTLTEDYINPVFYLHGNSREMYVNVLVDRLGNIIKLLADAASEYPEFARKLLPGIDIDASIEKNRDFLDQLRKERKPTPPDDGGEEE